MKFPTPFFILLFLSATFCKNSAAQIQHNSVVAQNLAPLPYAVDLFGTQFSERQLKNINEEYHRQLLKRNPNWDKERAQYEQRIQEIISSQKNLRITQSNIVIPVVVHIVYHEPIENISDAQVFSQLVVLNEDFTRSAADTVNTPAPFAAIAANPGIEFCLATKDPNGNTTTGIERRYTTDTIFNFTDNVKFFSTGGLDAWDPSRYFNIWVCNTGGVCWGEFPTGTLSYTHGAVMHYIYMGSDWTSYGYFPVINWYYDRGEIGVHEIGHCFNLRHIWGDDGTSCAGSDTCADTPNQQGPSAYCPVFPLYDSCTAGGNGIMFNNFMDYSDDDCYNMFTLGQSARMHAVLSIPPYNALPLSDACGSAVGMNDANKNFNALFSVVAQNNASLLQLNFSEEGTFELISPHGKIFLRKNLQRGIETFDVSGLADGIYFLRFSNGDGVAAKKIVLNK
jgi:hypothetical protein